MQDRQTRLHQIRHAEAQSHMDAYSRFKLYEEGSWLQKPVKTVLNLIPNFSDESNLRILDLGSGIGRNCIPVAMNLSCIIDCVDILPYAIEKLQENAARFRVEDKINPIHSSIDDFPIKPNYYDWIMAISALEHMDSEDSLRRKLAEIKDGIRPGGIVLFIMNSDIVEYDPVNQCNVTAQFEVNLSTQALQELLDDTFFNWQIIKSTVNHQCYEIPRNHKLHILNSNVKTYAARKPE